MNTTWFTLPNLSSPHLQWLKEREINMFCVLLFHYAHDVVLLNNSIVCRVGRCELTRVRNPQKWLIAYLICCRLSTFPVGSLTADTFVFLRLFYDSKIPINNCHHLVINRV